MSNIKICYEHPTQTLVIPHTKFNFSAGEVQVRIDTTYLNEIKKYDKFLRLPASFYFHAVIRSSDDILELIMLESALRSIILSYDFTPKEFVSPFFRFSLHMPYFPYSRQDRVCYPGEADSFDVMAGILGDIFGTIYTWDLHNPSALGGDKHFIKSLDSSTLFGKSLKNRIGNPENYILISPDKGAKARVESFASEWEMDITNVQVMDKNRDPNTGVIGGFVIPNSLYEINSGRHGLKHVLIIDDIIDGGRTFIELAKILLQNLDIGRIYLFATHGVFSQGLDPFRGLIDKIYVGNSWIEPKDSDILEIVSEEDFYLP